MGCLNFSLILVFKAFDFTFDLLALDGVKLALDCAAFFAIGFFVRFSRGGRGGV